MSGNGRGSINAKLDTWRSAGKHQELALQLLDSAVHGLENAKENVPPNKLRKVHQQLDTAAQQAAVARQALQKSGQQWQRAAKVDYTVRSEVTAIRRTGLGDDGAMKTLQEYNAGDSRGEKSCPTPMDTDVDGGTSIRGGYEVRQRTITVEGHQIMGPSRGSWYQTSEAVRILYDLRQRNIRIAKQVVEAWRSKNPPWIDISYQRIRFQVQRVEEYVKRTGCTVDDSIKRLIVDRAAVNEAPLAGRPSYMSKPQFVDSVLESKTREESSNKSAAVQVLNDAKKEAYARRGLRPPKAHVHPNTVNKYWQHMGGKENPTP